LEAALSRSLLLRWKVEGQRGILIRTEFLNALAQDMPEVSSALLEHFAISVNNE